MWAIVVSACGWILGKILGKGKEAATEKKYVEAKKENLELRAEIAGRDVRDETEAAEDAVKKEWEEAGENDDARRKYEILKRDFDSDD